MDDITLALRLVVATLLTGVIGFNRELGGHSAGLRTHMLVGMGAALFTELSIVAFPGGDSARIAAQIVSGIGFLGAGAIVRRSNDTNQGLTTAAGIWAVSAIGMAAGAGYLVLATVGTVIMLSVLTVVGFLERHGLRRGRSRSAIKRQKQAPQNTNESADAAGNDA